MQLKDRVAIVTGGALGIGRATVERFVQAGAGGVVLADILKEQGQAAAREIMQSSGGQVLAVPVDVSDPAQVEEMVRLTLARFGRLDILVNNAAIMPLAPWDELTLDTWNRVLAVNLTGMFLCTRAVLPTMKAQHYGRIVYVTSDAAYSGSFDINAAYGVSKAGIQGLMYGIATGLAADGIRANSVAPGGPIPTPMGLSAGQELQNALRKNTLLKRDGSPYEIADAILFLASDRSSFITGQVLRINGGKPTA